MNFSKKSSVNCLNNLTCLIPLYKLTQAYSEHQIADSDYALSGLSGSTT